MSMQPPHQRPCPECGGPRILNQRAMEMWTGSSSMGYFLDVVICTVCGYTSLYTRDLQQHVAEIQKTAAKREAAEQERLRRAWEKQQKRQGR